jgi:PAS domain S-box-containing protein
MVDLTSRLEAQKQMEEQVNLMRELTSAVPAIIWQLSLDGRCIFISDHWRSVTGSSPQDAIRDGWIESVHPDDRSAVKMNLGELLSCKKQKCSFECRLLGSARDWRWTLVEAQQIHSMEGELRGVVGNTIDITERKKAQQSLLELNSSLEQRVLERTQAFLQSNEALKVEIEHRRHTEEMLEEKRAELDHVERLSLAGQLSGELAHELNQPLNAIQNYVGSLSLLASNLPQNDSAVKILGQLNKEISRAAKIIKRTRDFVSTGKHQPEQIDICEIILDTAAMLKGEARRRGMQIQVKMESQTSPFLGDKVGLQQVLVNLILNAIDSMVGHPASDKIILVEMITQPDRIIIAVRDTGSGVPESEVKKLFEAFFTTKTTGLGMGLAISQRIIESHRGTLRYEPRENRGSSFVIELPFLEKSSNERNASDTKAKSS